MGNKAFLIPSTSTFYAADLPDNAASIDWPEPLPPTDVGYTLIVGRLGTPCQP